MSEPVLRAYVIGQTPRPDLTADLERRLPGIAIEVVGALDGLSPEAIETCAGCAYPLETLLADGTRLVVDAAYVEDRLQAVLDAYDGPAIAHLVLCAGPFPTLAIGRRSGGPPAAGAEAEAESRAEMAAGATTPLLLPFDTAVRALREKGHRQLAVLVPFEAQAHPAKRKWLAEGFAPARVHALTEKPEGSPLPQWIASWAREPDADAVIFDYVGFASDLLDEVASGTGLPVIDLGHLTFDLLADTIHAS